MVPRRIHEKACTEINHRKEPFSPMEWLMHASSDTAGIGPDILNTGCKALWRRQPCLVRRFIASAVSVSALWNSKSPRGVQPRLNKFLHRLLFSSRWQINLARVWKYCMQNMQCKVSTSRRICRQTWCTRKLCTANSCVDWKFMVHISQRWSTQMLTSALHFAHASAMLLAGWLQIKSTHLLKCFECLMIWRTRHAGR